MRRPRGCGPSRGPEARRGRSARWPGRRRAGGRATRWSRCHATQTRGAAEPLQHRARRCPRRAEPQGVCLRCTGPICLDQVQVGRAGRGGHEAAGLPFQEELPGGRDDGSHNAAVETAHQIATGPVRLPDRTDRHRRLCATVVCGTGARRETVAGGRSGTDVIGTWRGGSAGVAVGRGVAVGGVARSARAAGAVVVPRRGATGRRGEPTGVAAAGLRATSPTAAGGAASVAQPTSPARPARPAGGGGDRPFTRPLDVVVDDVERLLDQAGRYLAACGRTRAAQALLNDAQVLDAARSGEV